MAKPDFPPLLAPGVHTHTLDVLKALAVDAFPHDDRRALLFQNFEKWLGEFTGANCSGRIWLDGSFLTQKPSPDDIDFIVWDPHFTAPPTPADHQAVRRLFDKSVARVQYNLDVYVQVTHPDPSNPDSEFHRGAYWRGLFGYCHDRVTAKGFVEVHV